MLLLVSSALTLALIESSNTVPNQVEVSQSGLMTMSANNVTNGHNSFLWNTFTGNGDGAAAGGVGVGSSNLIGQC